MVTGELVSQLSRQRTWRTLEQSRTIGPHTRPMPRDIRTRRPARTVQGVAADKPTGARTVTPPVLSLLVHSARINDVLPHLHQEAIEATGGSCTLLFEQNPRNGALQATSGFGLDALPTEPLVAGADETALINDAFTRRTPTLVPDADRQMPELATRLGARAALLMPLARGTERVGLLAIGFEQPPNAGSVHANATEVADAFLATIELFRLRQAQDLQRDLLELITEFGESLSATLNLSAGLDIFCHGANRLFGADRTSVWIHDRRARHLVLRASSDPEHVARGVRVGTDDVLSPAAAAMRHARAEIAAPDVDAVTCTVTVPLRGTRRALGTIVFEGVRVEPGGELALLDRADELGRQLSSAVENMQLLADVMRSRRELENTFDSITDLVAVSDRRGRIVHVNHAFASRVGSTRDQLIDRPLADYIGPDLTLWLAEHESDGARPRGHEPLTREIFDPVLKGGFLVTITDLLNQER